MLRVVEREIREKAKRALKERLEESFLDEEVGDFLCALCAHHHTVLIIIIILLIIILEESFLEEEVEDFICAFCAHHHTCVELPWCGGEVSEVHAVHIIVIVWSFLGEADVCGQVVCCSRDRHCV